jgi:hypothetical protein
MGQNQWIYPEISEHMEKFVCVQTVCYPHVRNAKTAKEAWNNLKTAYENQGISRHLVLKKEIIQDPL